MDTEFHYYITGIIAHAAGFTQKDAALIAWASEFTDENDEVIKVQDRVTNQSYTNYISQTMNILKPKHKLMRIYPVFHFVPGEPDLPSTRRADGKMHILNTTPDGGLAGEWLDEALKVTSETRPYRIGIATHAYADTWAHQNFVGWYDYFNNIALDPKPDIGHADAEHHPDWVAHRWDDSRLVEGEVNNTERFLSAAKCVYDRYRSHLGARGISAKKPWEDLRGDLYGAMGQDYSGCFKCDEAQRLRAYKALAPWLKKFDKDKWKKDAMEGNFLELVCDGCWNVWKMGVDVEKTDWYRFQEAVKDHQAQAMTQLDPLFARMGVDLHKL